MTYIRSEIPPFPIGTEVVVFEGASLIPSYETRVTDNTPTGYVLVHGYLYRMESETEAWATAKENPYSRIRIATPLWRRVLARTLERRQTEAFAAWLQTTKGLRLSDPDAQLLLEVWEKYKVRT